LARRKNSENRGSASRHPGAFRAATPKLAGDAAEFRVAGEYHLLEVVPDGAPRLPNLLLESIDFIL
jgi:hypothetical protein